MHRNFADWYKATSLDTDGPRLIARWAAVDALAVALKIADVPDLTRIFYQRAGDNAYKEKVKESAKSQDPTFLIENSDTELSILAGGIIARTLAEPSELANATALAVSCTEAQGLRQDGRLQGVVDEIMQYLATESARVRDDQVTVSDIEAAELDKLLVAARSSSADPTSVWPNTEGVLQKLIAFHAKHTRSINEAITVVQRRQREESDILWWLFSEHTIDGQAFSDLTVGEACFRGARDLATLTRDLPGPFAAPAFLKKMLSISKKSRPSAITVTKAVDTCPLDLKRQWANELSLQHIPELSPILFALTKSVEAGGSTEWTDAFQNSTGLRADGGLSPGQLAQQIYQEALLQRALRA
jgi:GTPase-associated system helical domain